MNDFTFFNPTRIEFGADKEQRIGQHLAEHGIKKVLLDQNMVSGIGNIYADEALWRAKLHYAQPANTLAREQALALLDHARDVMMQALDQGGTSFDSLYVNCLLYTSPSPRD